MKSRSTIKKINHFRTMSGLILGVIMLMITQPAISADTPPSLEYYQKGYAALENSNYPEAIAAFQKSLQQDTLNSAQKVKVISELAYLSILFNKNDEAIKSYLIILDLDPTFRFPPAPLTEQKILDVFDQAFSAWKAKDTESPTIVHTPPQRAYYFQPLLLSAKVTDDRGIAKVILWYRNGDTKEFTQKVLETNSTNEYSATLGDLELKGGMLDYYLSAEDVTGKTSTLGNAEHPNRVELDYTPWVKTKSYARFPSLIAGLAGLGAGTFYYIQYYNDSSPKLGTDCQDIADCQDIIDSAKQKRTASFVFFGAGTALIATNLYLSFFDKDIQKKQLAQGSSPSVYVAADPMGKSLFGAMNWQY